MSSLPPPTPYPHLRRRFIEFHEQPWTPSYIRRPVQEFLSLGWRLKWWPLQSRSPAELAAEVIDDILERISGDKDVQVVDFCSGAGGPVSAVEKIINSHRARTHLSPIPFVVSDLHPHTSAWRTLSQESHSLLYIDAPVDATNAPKHFLEGSISGTSQTSKTCTMRTFFLAFHHFDEEGAKRVLMDAMEHSDAVGIFELQHFDLGNIIVITMFGLLPFVTAPFYLPFNIVTLFFTYIIPIVPIILVLDGYVSAYRTRSFEHIKHLASQATLDLARKGVEPTGGREWVWESGSRRHTWPGGRMYWFVGRRADR